MNTQKMRNSLYVHVDVGEGNIILAGQLIVSLRQGITRFKYARKYCRHEKAYAIDPINLPLSEGAIFESPITRDSLGIAGALLDAGPDDWGKRLLINLLDPPPSTDLEFLLAGSGNGVGTLYFTEDRDEVPRQQMPREFCSIEDIMETALRLDEGRPVSQEKAMFFAHGSSIGGSRPKTFIDERYTDENSSGNVYWKRWIVKFRGKGDLVDHPILEHESMQMAADAGINVAETKVMDTALGSILLIKRFDIDTNSGEQFHMISAKSLINASQESSPSSDQESYQNIGRIAQQITATGATDTHEIFRRMLFNIAIGNVDDHMKNHAFYQPKGKTLKLTPAYDVLPTVGRQCSPQAIMVGQDGYRQGPENIAQCAEEMGIDPATAAEMAEDVLNATKDWEERLINAGLSAKEVAIIGQSMKARQHITKYLDAIPLAQRRREAQASQAFSISR